MNSFNSLVKYICILIIGLQLTGCATQTAISKRNLDVQNKMSNTIFLDPVAPDKRIAFLQIKNTSDKSGLDLGGPIRSAIINKGYKLVDDPAKAQFMIQANVLQVGKSDLLESEQALKKGYGDSTAGAALAGAAAGNLVSDTRQGVLSGALLGAAANMMANALIKDIVYTIITDIQISERVNGVVQEQLDSSLQQGSNSKLQVTASTEHSWKRYQTRIISTANKVNLKFEEALPHLISGLSRSISGVLS